MKNWKTNHEPNHPDDLIETYEIPTEASLEYDRKKQAGLLGNKCHWVGFRRKKLLELAKQSRNALLAVLVELGELHFRAWDKKASIEYNSAGFRKLGFNHHDKIRALKVLEVTGWVSVKWRKQKAPLVTILQGFHLGS